jgi:hypothetical protein
MAKKTYPAVNHGLEGWDTELDAWRTLLQSSPLPIFRPTSGLFANLPTAAQNDDGIAVIADPTAGVILVLSNGSVWRRIPVQSAAQVDSVAATVGALVTDFNALLAKFRTAGVMA